MNPSATSTPDVVTQIENLPWYQSTQGPMISQTVKAMAGLLLPTIQLLFHISTGIDVVDRLIDAALVLGFGTYALYGYIRAKKTLGAVIAHYRGPIGPGFNTERR